MELLEKSLAELFPKRVPLEAISEGIYLEEILKGILPEAMCPGKFSDDIRPAETAEGAHHGKVPGRISEVSAGGIFEGTLTNEIL